jgi:hypothetical protein
MTATSSLASCRAAIARDTSALRAATLLAPSWASFIAAEREASFSFN